MVGCGAWVSLARPLQTVQTHRTPGPQRIQLLQARPWLVLHVSRMQPRSWLSLCWGSMLYIVSLLCMYVCTVGTRAVSGCAFLWQQCTWGVGVRWDFRLRCLHWSCHWTRGRAGVPTGFLQAQGGSPSVVPGRLVLLLGLKRHSPGL
uniref:Uncharacterized protein n=1 Tax=Myotis myotis TaxID=51298 RepID=A0A7J7XHJ9_MYOMY|nr:hypothetical protein mMyoMyo1_011753 [Myotis myotis]